MTGDAPLLGNICDYVVWYAHQHPDAVALVHDGHRLSYRELLQRVDRLSAALLAAGVHRGVRVATLSTPSPDFIISLLAASSIGAIWVGLNPRYRLAELSHVVSDATPLVLLGRRMILGRTYEPEVAALCAACPSLERVAFFDGTTSNGRGETIDEFLAGGATVATRTLDEARAAARGSDPCLLVYTSGSTGTPKGALLHHTGIIAFARMCNALWPVSPHKVINYFPINHIGSIIDCMMPCLVAGGTQVMLEQFDAHRCLELIERERITLWGSVPSVFQMQLSLPDFSEFDLSSVQLIAWGGAAMQRETVSRLRSICPRLATNYGMTETSSAITMVEPTGDIDILVDTVGLPRPDIEMRIADEAGHPVGCGQPGEIQVRSASNFVGYWQQPEATQEAFTADGFFRTGDLGEQRSDGRVRLIGRLKEMYKSGGYNVYPREVESVLESHPAVAAAAVVSIPDPLWQEVGIAYVVPQASVTPEQLEQHCRDRLANYKLPKCIILANELPLLPIGKVDKRALRTQARDIRMAELRPASSIDGVQAP